MRREAMIASLREASEPWDLAIIGGGATGLGAAVDAASRGYRVCLVERDDFAKGTSSRSTKLVHGGVRYLQQGNVSLVMEALRERGRLLKNAPHIVSDLAFVVPSYAWWESPWYGIGLRVYDTLAGRYGFGRSGHLSREEVTAEIPTLSAEGLRGGTRYYDGQFDDARLAINLATTAAAHGAVLVNHAPAVALRKHGDGTVSGVECEDTESGERIAIEARAVINATGPFADEIRRLDDPSSPAIIRPSQGVHLVLDRSFLPGDHAIMVPHTSDGRVMFAIPWHHVCVVGTTDTPIDAVDAEPVAQPEEIAFILDTANRYLARPATTSDIRSVFAGVRPLVVEGDAGEGSTAAVSRDHSILISQHSGLITIAGGKWTTYRRMAEEVVDQAAMLADLEPRRCVTRDLVIHGGTGDRPAEGEPLAPYGADAASIASIARDEPALAEPLHERLPVTGAEIAWACRAEMARTLDDALSRRTRCLLFDARAAAEAAPRAAAILARELGRDEGWQAAEIDGFTTLANRYLPPA